MPGTITTDLTLVNTTGGDAESLTNWTTTAAWSAAPALSNDVFLQGSNAINARASSATPGTDAVFWDHLTTGTANLNLTGTGLCVYFWIKCFCLPSMQTRVKGGLGVSISSTAGVTTSGTAPWVGILNSGTWFVLGSESDPLSGWACYVVDPQTTPDYTNGTPVYTTVNRIGIRADAVQTVGGGSVKPNPVIWDALRYGTGITVVNATSGSPAAFSDLYSTDSQTANQWGIVTKTAGIYLLAGKINLGTTAQTAVTNFVDTNQVCVFQNYPVRSGFYALVLNGAASFATTVTFGQISSGLVSSGCTFKGTGWASQRLIAAAIVSAGTGYTANDILTVSGGTGTAATMRVISVSSGVITSLQMETAGSYSSPPTGTLTLTGGTGSGATATATIFYGSMWTLTASAANQTLNLYGCTLSDMLSAALASTTTINGCTFSHCGTITPSSASITNCVFRDMATLAPFSSTYQITVSGSTPTLTSNTFVNCATAIKWDVATDPNGKLDGCTFTSGGTGYAIELGPNCPTSITLNNVAFSGYGSTGTANAAIFNNSGKSITINITGTGSAPTYNNGSGASTTIVAGTVTTTVTVVDLISLSAISGAEVLVIASNTSGPMPFQKSTTITRSGTTATAACTAHGLIDGKQALIQGADQQAYNGVVTISVVDADHFTYTVSGSPATPATGTIVTTGVVIWGATNGSGVISDTRTHSADQPITGRVRKATTAPYYQTGAILGTISHTTGLSVTVQMVLDQ